MIILKILKYNNKFRILKLMLTLVEVKIIKCLIYLNDYKLKT